MLDRYWHGSCQRISPEAPVPVVKIDEVIDRPGGAANVAVNIAELGVAVCLLGITGADDAAQSLRRCLQQYPLEHDVIEHADCKTITKLRVLSQSQQMLRLDFEDGFAAVDNNALVSRFQQRLQAETVVVLSDYDKGTLNTITPALIKTAREQNCAVLIDPKGDDFDRYRGATLLTPNLHEFQAIVGECRNDNELEQKAETLRRQLELGALLITWGEQGMVLLQQDQPVHYLSAQAREVYDVTGAGDTVIAVLAGALAAGSTLNDAAALANLAAGIVVGKLGTASVSQAELQQVLGQSTETHSSASAIVSEDALLQVVQQARQQDEKIVMTNGCFDILHAGHVAYLEQARKLGDRLIIAINDDDSTRRLKGPQRPVNKLQDRLQVLAGLQAVDWVVAFSEDTPERLICRILPDYLVKGGDYKAEQVAGGQCVQQAGGEVIILDYLAGYSTTKVVERMRAFPADS